MTFITSFNKPHFYHFNYDWNKLQKYCTYCVPPSQLLQQNLKIKYLLSSTVLNNGRCLTNIQAEYTKRVQNTTK